jgi:AcrR family transcriptional regulator
VGEQGDRLLAAMTEAAARHGYRGATVARTLELAGVSRATFYERFSSREECFAAAYDRGVGRIHGRLRAVAIRAGGGSRPREVLGALLAALGAEPSSMRLVLVESLGGGAARTRHERLIALVETNLEGILERENGLSLSAVAVVGGLTGVLAGRLMDEGRSSLPALLDHLLAWLRSYASSGDGDRIGAEAWSRVGRPLVRGVGSGEGPAPAPLPRGRHALDPAAAAAGRRERILTATARVVARRGYADARIADIASAARVSRGAFYAEFDSKEDAFLAAQTAALQASMAAAAARFSLAGPWPERVWSAGEAMLSYVAANPDLARLAMLEVQAAGEAAIRLERESRMAYVLFLEEGYREAGIPAERVAVLSEAISAAVFALMRRQVARARTQEMLEVLPQAAFVILAPFTGPAWAREFVLRRSRPEPSGLRAAI